MHCCSVYLSIPHPKQTSQREQKVVASSVVCFRFLPMNVYTHTHVHLVGLRRGIGKHYDDEVVVCVVLLHFQG